MATQAQTNKLLLERTESLARRVAALEATAHTHAEPETPVPPVVIPPPSGAVVEVGDGNELRTALVDNRVGLIMAHDGSYTGDFRIGAKYAARTNPVAVRAVNKHKAVIEGALLRFEEGAHHQQWLGFRHSNMRVVSNGVITLGGYGGTKAAHHIEVGDGWIDSTCVAGGTKGRDGSQDHAIYPAHGTDDGPHDFLFRDMLIDADNLNGALHSWHPEGNQAGYQPHDITFQRIKIRNPRWGIAVGHLKELDGYVFDQVEVTGARESAIAWWLLPRVKRVVFRDFHSTGSRYPMLFEGNRKDIPPGLPGFVFEGVNTFA